MRPFRADRRRGSAIVELGLIFIPLVFMLLGSIELARGMWMYHTLTTAIKSGGRYATVHGADCIAATSGCQVTVADVARIIQGASVGMDAGQLQLTLTADGTDYSCGTLTQCLTNSTAWPPASGNQPGLGIKIKGIYSFQPVVPFWPGQQSSVNYFAEANEIIQF